MSERGRPRLIEVALSIREISVESARDNSLPQGEGVVRDALPEGWQGGSPGADVR